jgi:purine nucleoside permease
MASPHAGHRTTKTVTNTVKILPTGLGKWTATMQTANGPMTAIGDSIAEAKTELDRLIVIARALELTHRHRDQ